MKIYEDKFGRCIWLSIKQEEIRMDLQDLAPNFEYERCATVTDVSGLCKAMDMNFNELADYLYVLVDNKNNAFDLFTDFLNAHRIEYAFFSG